MKYKSDTDLDAKLLKQWREGITDAKLATKHAMSIDELKVRLKRARCRITTREGREGCLPKAAKMISEQLAYAKLKRISGCDYATAKYLEA